MNSLCSFEPRRVVDPYGSPQTRSLYELQALAYALWLSNRDGMDLSTVASWRPVWSGNFISVVEFYRNTIEATKQALRGNLVARVAIPNPDPATQVCALVQA